MLLEDGPISTIDFLRIENEKREKLTSGTRKFLKTAKKEKAR